MTVDFSSNTAKKESASSKGYLQDSAQKQDVTVTSFNQALALNISQDSIESSARTLIPNNSNIGQPHPKEIIAQ